MFEGLLEFETLPGIIIRSATVYVFIVFAIRLFGKKELAQLSVVDLVFILLISNAVQNAMVGPSTTLIGGVVAAFTLFIVNFILKKIIASNKRIKTLIEGEAVLLIKDGIVNPINLKAIGLTEDELNTAIREHGVKSIKEVNLAYMETDGNISVISDSFKRKTSHKRKAHRIIRKEM